MQPQVNLIYREEEREMLPFCLDSGVGVIPWSPLARGKLARPWETKTERSENDAFAKALYDANADNDRKVVEAVIALAGERGVPPAQVALAWLLHKPGITAPIVGPTKAQHLDDAAAATALTLSAGEIERLEAPYAPHPIAGVAGPIRPEHQVSLLKTA
jgi:aryl-alcohol dehydrogenase-like predicted oxidoreductase